ncbi:Gfo/Idh/MocA family protein [Gehongia tenuis]|uniref:Gfo/Idh/MocA family oxidoreductase n=1 Tax=Gehongia tenuis TaxID=2763655 RepID=A0A926HKV8_9FIRM|nr:Gfo/Idh/MocA family oxidoreductase [Gehongia tenuis]MBC8531407.1 Gfo/Idh/MocA family oxidoreductase [Gehongia tenuis]
MIHVGILGCGAIAQRRHAPEYKANPNVEILGYFDPVEERCQYMVDTFGGKAYASYQQMLEDPKIDAVSICGANKIHASATIQALWAGKHVLCEKPMANNLQECQEMINVARQTGKTLMIGHNQRFFPAHLKAKEILASGELGEVISFHSTFSHGGPEFWSIDKSGSPWFFKKDGKALGGVLADLGVHKIDIIRWLVGSEVEYVQAFAGALNKCNSDGSRIEVDDNAMCILNFENGAAGTVTASWTNYGDEEKDSVVYCTKGKLIIDGKGCDRLTLQYREGGTDVMTFEEGSSNDHQVSSGVIDEFVESIMQGRKPLVSGEDGLMAIHVVTACLESARTGQRVHLQKDALTAAYAYV